VLRGSLPDAAADLGGNDLRDGAREALGVEGGEVARVGGEGSIRGSDFIAYLAGKAAEVAVSLSAAAGGEVMSRNDGDTAAGDGTSVFGGIRHVRRSVAATRRSEGWLARATVCGDCRSVCSHADLSL